MRTELRLALAMRGGVSLAVWIGGAVSEIDLARRARGADPVAGPDFWSEVLHGATAYDRVIVDVLAGASAGGLNCALYAASQIYRFPYDEMRDVWLTVGGTEGLVRREPPWPSLFKGDHYFLKTVHQKLVDLTRSAPPHDPSDARRPRVEMALSATVMEPIIRPLPSPEDEPLVERRYAAGFRFRQPEEPWLPTDFPGADQTGFADTLWRLAIAARSTSSYPGAFEAAEVRSSRRATFDALAATDGSGPQVDLDGTFLDRTTGLPFVVADGGILDNIPIQCALDFIANAPASGPTERFLVYLQPGASTSQKTTAALAVKERRTTLAVVRGVLGARVAGETINGDIAAIEAYNEAIERAANLRHATFSGLPDRTTFMAAAPKQRPAYRLTRASLEARQVFTLLLDPMGFMGEDQFPKTVAGQPVEDGRWRSPIAGWAQQDRETLEAALNRKIAGLITDRAPLFTCTGDPAPLLRVTDLLIAWARWVEGLRTSARNQPGLTAAGDAKGTLYRVRAFLGAILERTRRMAWVSAAAVTDKDHTTFVDRAVGSLGRLTFVDQDAAQATVDALRTGARGPLEDACRQALTRIDGVVGEVAKGGAAVAPPADGSSVDLLAAIGDLLVELVGPLASAPQRSTDLPGEEFETAELLHRVLSVGPVTIEVLEALEMLCLPEFVSGMPGRRRIDFRRLSTANRTPLTQHFTTLLDAAADQGLWWDPTVPREEQPGIHVTLKLAGNELANFSAFLLSQWRANDWLWGRLDAVPTLIELLVRPAPLQTHLAGCSDEEALEKIHHLVAPPNHPWKLGLDALVWAPGMKDVAAEVGRLLKAGAKAEKVEKVEIPCIRTALVARRQWEILGQEKALPTDQMGRPPGVGPDQPTLEAVQAWVGEYGVGAETVQRHKKAPELLDRFGEIATAATEMALYNVSLESSRIPAPTRIVATAVRRLGPALGRRLAKGLVVGKSAPGGSRTKKLIGLAAAVIAVMAVLGWFIDRTAFLLGFAVSFAPLAFLVWRLYKRIRKVLEKQAEEL